MSEDRSHRAYGKCIAAFVALAFIGLSAVAVPQDEGQTKDQIVGRVAIRLNNTTPQQMRDAAQALFGQRLSETPGRVLSSHPVNQGGFQVIVYVDAEEKAYRVTTDAQGKELIPTPLDHQPPIGVGEFEGAAKTIRADERWRAARASGAQILYQ